LLYYLRFYSRFQDLTIKYRVKEAKRADEITSGLNCLGSKFTPHFFVGCGDASDGSQLVASASFNSPFLRFRRKAMGSKNLW
jgi:hypothetical protein